MLKSEKLRMAAEAVILCDKYTPERKLTILETLIDMIGTAEYVEQRDREAEGNEKD